MEGHVVDAASGRRSSRERKRVVEPELPSGKREKTAAIDFLKNKRAKPLMEVAALHGVSNHSHIIYGLKKWSGSELETGLLAGDISRSALR